MKKFALTGGLTMAGLTAVMLVPRLAAADMTVAVQAPAVTVSVNGPNGPAPGPGYVWQPESYVRENGAWVRRPGYWRPVQPTAAVPVYEPVAQQPCEADMAPPPPVVEVQPAAPVVGAVWIPGYWQWTGRRHNWVAGRWSAPRPGYVWVAQRWDRHGNRWASAPGHWQVVNRGRDHDHDHDRRGGWDRNHHGRNDHGRHR
jgi:hypothetical protein